MRIIIWRIYEKNSLLFTLGALLTALMMHICCWGPLVLVPLGFGGVKYAVGDLIQTYKFYFNLMPFLMLLAAGWRTYRRGSHLIEKVAFWISVLLVSAMMLL